MSSDGKGGFSTRAIHDGHDPLDHFGAVNPPVFLTSTYVQSSPGQHQGFEYSRSGNPTRAALEAQLKSIENAGHGFAFSSGLAACDVVIKACASPGAKVVCADDLYGGTFRIFDKTFRAYGIQFEYVDTSNADNVSAACNDETTLVWMESPSNPLLKISNIEEIADIAHRNGALLVVDNTFATPYLQQPLDLGADIVLHSATKYLGGHSDVVLGAIMCKDNLNVHDPIQGAMKLEDAIFFHQNATGGVPGPLDCYLVNRGIKTLAVRMERHCDNAEKIVDFLKDHKRVTKVFYPGLESHVNSEVAAEQMRRPGGMISFEIDGSVEDGVKVVSGRKYWTLGESLGGIESLIEHPCSMTHASIPKELRQKAGLEDGLIRCSVGIENVEDLISDLEEGLAAY